MNNKHTQYNNPCNDPRSAVTPNPPQSITIETKPIENYPYKPHEEFIKEPYPIW